MKRIISAIAAIFCCVAMSVAQTNFIATLQHDGNFRHFYGQDALTAAYAAAADGDIITLSPGTFTWSGDFTKGITLRGNGIDAAEKTYISGSVNFYSESSNLKTVVEGVWFTGSVYVYNDASGDGQGHISFIKDNITRMYASSSSQFSKISGPKVRIYNCKVGNTSFGENTYPDFVFCNCTVINPNGSYKNFGSNISAFVNCYIDYNRNYNNIGRPDLAYYLNFYNCIFTPNSYDAYRLKSTASCFNCLCSSSVGSFFDDLQSGSNIDCRIVGGDIFSGSFGTSPLTEDAKSKYIGTDGTEIGIYGGMYPWNNTVQYPTVTTFQPEPKTSKEGILNIQVAVDEE